MAHKHGQGHGIGFEALGKILLSTSQGTGLADETSDAPPKSCLGDKLDPKWDEKRREIEEHAEQFKQTQSKFSQYLEERLKRGIEAHQSYAKAAFSFTSSHGIDEKVYRTSSILDHTSRQI